MARPAFLIFDLSVDIERSLDCHCIARVQHSDFKHYKLKHRWCILPLGEFSFRNKIDELYVNTFYSNVHEHFWSQQ
ncbi:hypothetical protein KC347_g1331 [Hortaea werneckii]|nr:hypothetical protein KC347_g1331 [Hortaea werneckii]